VTCRPNAKQIRLYNADARKRMSQSAAPGRRGQTWGGGEGGGFVLFLSLIHKLKIGVRQMGSARPESDREMEWDIAADGDERTSLLLKSSTKQENKQRDWEAAQSFHEETKKKQQGTRGLPSQRQGPTACKSCPHSRDFVNGMTSLQSVFSEAIAIFQVTKLDFTS
jgi:hypothetical protein